MRKQTDLAKVKQTARSLLFTDIHETEFSPVIVSHPFTDSGFVAYPNADGEIGLLNITESDADQRRWREYTAPENYAILSGFCDLFCNICPLFVFSNIISAEKWLVLPC